MTTTVPEPSPAAHREFFATETETVPSERREAVDALPRRVPAVFWVDSIFYAAVTVFVSSLVAYFLLD